MRSKAAALGAVLALSTTTLGLPPASGHAVPTVDRAARALGLLEADARGDVQVTRGPSGVARFVGVSGETGDPVVTSAMTPRAAARTHLQRYGAALGLGGSRLVAGRVTRSVTGDDVVRFVQRRDGLRVIGGSVAVDLRPDRQLGSVAASVSRAGLAPATYTRGQAAREALAAVRKRDDHPKGLVALRPGRRLYDPAVLGVARTTDPSTHARGVWRVVVSGGPAYRRLLLLDDRTGAVVQDVDLIERLDRVVCDDKNNASVDSPCDHDFARTESGPASVVADVNDAFDLAGVVSRYYQQIGGIDLTRLLGIDVNGHQELASTVRWCDGSGQDCPMHNAFWNGFQMFYGEGYAGADDVVGHEMTHGVIQHNANLLYWGQSGAINESIADVMGEIIDHRHVGPGDSATSWTLGEDLPGGAIRSVKNPPRFDQPDTMTSPLYAGGINDNGAVHTDSGVGNKAFYLISQGGTFHGKRITGIDGARLTRSATLYLSVIQHLVSGSDYADLASVLEQSCADLAARHTVGFTTADCRSVHRVTVATRMRTTPPAAPQPPDAPMACPSGSGHLRVLFNSETGKPRSKFLTGTTWSRAPSAVAPANATSGTRSWFSLDPEDIGVSSLVMRRPLPLPAHRRVYLWFEQWRVLDFIGHFVNDAGTVHVADLSVGGRARNASGLPWVNGPRGRIEDRFGNPAGGQLGFGRDSHGYVASRADLSSYAGHAVTPRFTMTTDDSIAYPGWYLDDIRVYTCGSKLLPTRAPEISGRATVGSRLTATRGRWSLAGVRIGYQWRSGGHAIRGATGPAYRVRAADKGHLVSVRVTAHKAHHGHTATISPSTLRVTRH